MKKALLSYAILAIIMATSCKKSPNIDSSPGFGKRNTNAATYPQTLPKQTITGNIVSDMTLTNDKVWELEGLVAVTNGATLTIQPGTFIIGKKKSPIDPGTLIITRNSKINAVGTAASPIVFTSYKLVDNDPATTPLYGDFGGIILLGNAQVNVVDKWIDGLNNVLFDSTYGGDNNVDNSGSMQYVRIEYAGGYYGKDLTFPGLMLGGVGNGTLLDYIQVSHSHDDSFAFFGGTVNATHLISLNPYDDSFDFNNGYRGKIQFAISVVDKNTVHSFPPTVDGGLTSDANGIECDNNIPQEAMLFNLEPRTRPIISNMTIVGTESIDSKFLKGARWRRGTRLVMANSIIMGYPVGVEFKVDNGVDVATEIDGTNSEFNNNMVQGFAAAANNPIVVNNYWTTASANVNIKLVQPFYNAAGTLNFKPAFGSAAISGASFTSTNLAGLIPVNYRGAMGTSDWTAIWSNFFL